MYRMTAEEREGLVPALADAAALVPEATQRTKVPRAEQPPRSAHLPAKGVFVPC